MSYHPNDTICAIATAAGGAARGMVRISGPDAIAIVARCFLPNDGESIEQLRSATARTGRFSVGRTILSVSDSANAHKTDRIVRPTSESWLPCDLFLWPTSRSYTREPVAELHTLGSPPLLQAVTDLVCSVGARLAEPGEFTLRAFLAGRLDLTQAEAVLGVVDARGADELDTALAQLAGGLARPLHELREQLLQLLAELEAGLDFVDEDIRFVSQDELLTRLAAGRVMLDEIAGQMASRHVAADRMQIALVGPPNVGKSSLFNALVTRFGDGDPSDRRRRVPALVSPQCGTTRDYLTATIKVNGMRCELVDTAGMGEPNNETPSFSVGENLSRIDPHGVADIEASARSQSNRLRSQVAIRAHCVEAVDVVAWDVAALQELATSDCDLVVVTKSDLMPHTSFEPLIAPTNLPIVATSSRTGAGLDDLCAELRELLTRDATQHGQIVAATANRCRQSVRLAESALRSAIEIASSGGGDELVAAEVRAALAELGKVVGAIYTDDLLDRIFKTFCIGK